MWDTPTVNAVNMVGNRSPLTVLTRMLARQLDETTPMTKCHVKGA